MIRLDPIDAGAIDRLEPLWLARTRITSAWRRASHPSSMTMSPGRNGVGNMRRFCGEGFGFIAHENGTTSALPALREAADGLDRDLHRANGPLWAKITIYVRMLGAGGTSAPSSLGRDGGAPGAARDKEPAHRCHSGQPRRGRALPGARVPADLADPDRFRRPAPAPQPVPAIATAPFDPAQVDAL